MAYKISTLVKDFRKSMSSIEEVDELIEIIDEGKSAYKSIFKKVTQFFKDNEDDYPELYESWTEHVDKYESDKGKSAESEKSESDKGKSAESESDKGKSAESESDKGKNAESDTDDSDKVYIKLKKTLDTSEFEDIEYIKNFNKEQLCNIYGEEKLKEYEHEGHIYYEWKILFGDFAYSIYTSDLGEDIMWIIAGNEKKNKKNLDLLYKEMNEILKE